jgi:hypothetical protein
MYRRRREWRWLLSEERKNPYPITLAKRLRAWKLGFLSQSYLLFNLDQRESIRNYITDGSRYLRFCRLNAPYSSVLHDKLLFDSVFRRHPNLVPETYALLRRGRVLAKSDVERIDSIDGVLDLLARKRRLVLKGTKGWGGTAVTVLEDLGGDVSLGGTRVSRDEARREIASRKEHLLTEYVEQAAYAREIFSDSANSIRMLTMIDPDTREPFLARAVHRFGSQSTGRIDNFSHGGVCAPIDLETGRLGVGVRVLPSGRPEPIERHPDTNAPITGTVIPGWHDAVRRLLDVAREHPYLPYVGWDVVVMDDGIRLLEGNANTGMNVLQVHAPLLDDPRIRRFYESRGVVRGTARVVRSG